MHQVPARGVPISAVGPATNRIEHYRSDKPPNRMSVRTEAVYLDKKGVDKAFCYPASFVADRILVTKWTVAASLSTSGSVIKYSSLSLAKKSKRSCLEEACDPEDVWTKPHSRELPTPSKPARGWSE